VICHRESILAQRRVVVGVAAVIASVGVVTPVCAQNAAQVGTATVQPTQDEESIAEVVVTGSRIARSGFTTPTPVTVIGADQMARQGASNIAAVLDEIPAFRAQSSPATTAIFVSNLGAATADLRGLGGNRTLVLIDGRRVVASAVSGGSFTPANTVDLNLVPSSLLSRAEVVTGGVAAVYGSDAVAGVVNLIINRDLQGMRGTVQYGKAEAGDAGEFLASLSYGTHFGDGHGRFVIGGEYVDNAGTGDCYTRSWCAVNYNTISNPFVAGSTTQRVIPNQPETIILPNARTATASLNGLIVSGPLRGTEFNSNGTTFAHDYGIYGGAGLFQSGGGDSVLPFYQFYPLSAPSQRVNVFSNLDYDLADAVNVFVQASYGHVEGTIAGASRRDVAPTGSYQIRQDNAFLPAAVRDQMVALNLATVPFGRIWNDIGSQVGNVKRDTLRTVVGADWRIAGSWNLEGYYQYGRTGYLQHGYNTTVNTRMAKAIDAVVNGAGQVVCRVNADANPANDDPACVPLNPFGAGASSAAARAYVTDTALQDTTLEQHVVALALNGNIVDLWAGPLAFAGGLEYRNDRVESTNDPISAANDFHTSPGGGIVGGRKSQNVQEGFVEVRLPLARDLRFARSAELNTAYRVTDYSNSGQVETWKIGADWQPIELLRLRATRSRDIRAPNLFELYGAPQSSFQTVDDPQNGGARGLYPTLLSGNFNLKPEVGDTWTAGAVVTARFEGAGTLRASADWFDISLDGAISTLGAQTIVTRCFQGATELCNFITRNSQGSITQIINPNLNLNTLITRGWDYEADYTLPLSVLGSGRGDSVNFRVLATVVKDLITVDTAGVATNRAGQNGSGVSQPSGLPDYTINGYITYQGNPFSAQLQIRYIAPGQFQVTNIGPEDAGYSPLLPRSIDDNSVPGVTYVNLNAQYVIRQQAGHRVELFGVINNLFDKEPPNKLPSSFGPTNNVLYDVIGRYYRAGVRVSF
jgi:outer membrane receptor protein involved in Fe transport